MITAAQQKLLDRIQEHCDRQLRLPGRIEGLGLMGHDVAMGRRLYECGLVRLYQGRYQVSAWSRECIEALHDSARAMDAEMSARRAA